MIREPTNWFTATARIEFGDSPSGSYASYQHTQTPHNRGGRLASVAIYERVEAALFLLKFHAVASLASWLFEWHSILLVRRLDRQNFTDDMVIRSVREIGTSSHEENT